MITSYNNTTNTTTKHNDNNDNTNDNDNNDTYHDNYNFDNDNSDNSNDNDDNHNEHNDSNASNNDDNNDNNTNICYARLISPGPGGRGEGAAGHRRADRRGAEPRERGEKGRELLAFDGITFLSSQLVFKLLMSFLRFFLS